MVEPPFTVDLTDGPTPTVAVHGVCDIATAPSLQACLDLVVAHGDRGVVVDLGDCPMIDSTTISLLVRTHRRLEERGARLTITNPTELVRRTLQVTGVDGYVDVAAS